MNAANQKLTQLKRLNDELIQNMLHEFQRIKLPLNSVRVFGNVANALQLTEAELSILETFYLYQTAVYDHFNSARDQMNVFDRQMDFVPYCDLPAAQLAKLNALLDEVVSTTGAQLNVMKEFVAQPTYQQIIQSVEGNIHKLQDQIRELSKLVTLNKSEPRDDAAIAKSRKTIFTEIGQITAEICLTMSSFNNSAENQKIFDAYAKILSIQQGLPTKMEFSFIRV